MNRINRVTSILIQLQSKKIIPAKEIAQRFNISLRTVYRDIRYLVKCRQHHGSAFGWTIPTKHHSRQQKTF